ncbi:MAG: 30S ribosomal protein S18 [Chloroflexi bacterium]|nr:30S ribosomal protein S18 [Chloroflexota bacterium]
MTESDRRPRRPNPVDRDEEQEDDRSGGPRGRRGGYGGGRNMRRRRRVCEFCVDKVEHIDYKRIDVLQRYLTERGKIKGRRKTGACAKHQRHLATAVKRARYLALLPYVSDHDRSS